MIFWSFWQKSHSRKLRSLNLLIFSLCVISSSLQASPLLAATPIEIGKIQDELKVDEFTDSWLGQANVSPEMIAQEVAEKSGVTRFGYCKQVIWLKFAIANPKRVPKEFVLRIEPALIDKISFTEIDSAGKIFNQKSFTPQARTQLGALERRRPSFLVLLPEDSVTTVVLRVSSLHSMDMHLKLATLEGDAADHLREQLVFGAYYGLLFTILLLNVLLFVTLRERVYLFYVLFLAVLVVELSTLNGSLSFYFENVFDFSRYLCVFSALTVVAGVIFTREFLQTKILAQGLDFFSRGLIGFATLLAGIGLSPLFPAYFPFFGTILDLVILSAVLLVIIASGIAIRKKYRPAGFFLMAWGILLVTICLYLASTYGIIHANVFSRYAIQVGSSAEMILLTIALASRVYLLKEQKIQAEEKARETDTLRAFIHIICHDLRNPLMVISGRAQVQLSRGNNEWASIVRAAESQKQILDYVQIKDALQSGKQKLKLVPVSINDTVDHAQFTFEEQLQSKKINFTTSIADDCVVLADRTLLTHSVISNIISNAIKFTPQEGTIEINSFVRGESVVVEVKDSGIGIPPELLKEIFSTTVATTRPGTHGETGSGFGMPLVKTAMDSFGGTIEVESVSSGFDEKGKAVLDKAKLKGTCVRLVLRKA